MLKKKAPSIMWTETEAIVVIVVIEKSNRESRIPSLTTMKNFMTEAIIEAKNGLKEGGIPIGSILTINDRIVGRGHNRRVQNGSAILHAEMDALENAGRLPISDYKKSILYSTLSPCDMCSGAVLLYGIPLVVIGENQTFKGPEDYVRSRGVTIRVLNDEECIKLMSEFIQKYPKLWNEDIGEPD